MGLEHEFYLINNTTNIKDFWMDREQNSSIIDRVFIHDDMIIYIHDSLNWVPSKNPAIEDIPSGYGINYTGVTLFDKKSANTLVKIFTAWRDLLSTAPHTLQLTGEYVHNRYEKLIFKRDDVIKPFDKMISMSKQLAEGDYYLYHCGI